MAGGDSRCEHVAQFSSAPIFFLLGALGSCHKQSASVSVLEVDY